MRQKKTPGPPSVPGFARPQRLETDDEAQAARAAARFLATTSGPRPVRRRSQGAGSGTALVKVVKPNALASPKLALGNPALASLLRVRSSRYVGPAAKWYSKTPVMKSANSVVAPIESERKSDDDPRPDPEAKVVGSNVM